MAANLEDQLIDKVRALPPNKREAALRLLEKLASESGQGLHERSASRQPLWEIIENINSKLPKDTWDNVPIDGSINLDHYLYGAPKRQP